MPLYTFACDVGHEWDERRDMNDPDLELSQEPCGPCSITAGGIFDTYAYEEYGRRLPFWMQGKAPAVYYHGRGWSQVDKNYGSNDG